MAGYIRQDTSNNIADGNVINSSDFDNEYNAIEAAFHATTGHTHDGTAAEGAAITKIGPTQDVVASATALTPKTDNTLDLGSSLLEFKDLYIDGTANIDSLVADTADINAGTIDGVTIGGASAGAATFTTATATTGNITTVNATTVDTTNLEVTNIKAKDGTASATIADATGVVSFSANPVLSAGTADGVLYLDGSKVATSGSALTFDGTNFAVSGTGIFGAGATKLRTYSDTTYSGIFNGASLVAAEAIYMGGASQFFYVGAAEQMRLTSTGLGIGTSSPGFKLDVGGSDGTNIALRSTGTTAAKFRAYVNGTESGVIGFLDGGGQYFEVAGTEAMRLDSSGNLGLGVTPSAWGSFIPHAIELPNGVGFASQSNAPVAHFSTNAYYDGSWRYKANGVSARYALGLDTHSWYTAPSGTAGNAISFTQSMTLDASGNLALGATGANARLDVVGGSIRVNEDSIGTKIITVRSDYAGLGPAINVTTSHPLLFLTNNTERARIKSTGQLRFVPLAADPAGAEAGDVYYNSGTNKLRLYDGSTWVDLN